MRRKVLVVGHELMSVLTIRQLKVEYHVDVAYSISEASVALKRYGDYALAIVKETYEHKLDGVNFALDHSLVVDGDDVFVTPFVIQTTSPIKPTIAVLSTRNPFIHINVPEICNLSTTVRRAVTLMSSLSAIQSAKKLYADRVTRTYGTDADQQELAKLNSQSRSIPAIVNYELEVRKSGRSWEVGYVHNGKWSVSVVFLSENLANDYLGNLRRLRQAN